MSRIVQIVLAMKKVSETSLVQELIGLDDSGRLWRKQLGSQWSLEWGEWELDSGKTIEEIGLRLE